MGAYHELCLTSHRFDPLVALPAGSHCAARGSQAAGEPQASHCRSNLAWEWRWEDVQHQHAPMVLGSPDVCFIILFSEWPALGLLGSKAGKFDVVFDNNVRKLEEIQPVVQGIKAWGWLCWLEACCSVASCW